MALVKFIPHYTVADYRTWQGDWELWSGVPVSLSPSSKQAHQRLSGRLFRWIAESLESEVGSTCEVFYELDWVVSDETVFRPDLLVVCGHQRTDFVEQTPSLVIEILSESTRKRDLLYKRDHYEQLGVKHYLIVDPDASSWTLLSLEDGQFAERDDFTLQLCDDCTVSLDLTTLFD